MPIFPSKRCLLKWIAFFYLLFLTGLSTSPAQAKVPAQLHAKASHNTILTFNDFNIDLPIFSVFVLPNASNYLSLNSDAKQDMKLITDDGQLTKINAQSWQWQAPSKPGLYAIEVKTNQSVSIHLNVFVLTPHDATDTKLNGYLIGEYPEKPLRGLSTYESPKGFIKVTNKNKNTRLTPHFSLSQFLCKQKLNGDQYIVLQEKLLFVLEDFVQFLAQKGHPVKSLSVMSGYRTPYYNAKIGNTTIYSRHAWGDAADIYIDEAPKDGFLDDLNQDGQITNADVDVLYQWIEEFQQRFEGTHFMGGLARYQLKGHRTPFVHLDTRGYKARWNG